MIGSRGEAAIGEREGETLGGLYGRLQCTDDQEDITPPIVAIALERAAPAQLDARPA